MSPPVDDRLPEYDEETQLALKLFVTLSRCYNSVAEQSRRSIQGFDLSMSEFAILELLYHKGPTPLGEIGEKILLTSGSITYVVDQLEKQGFAERVPSREDRRVSHATLTPAGREKISGLFPEHAEKLRSTLSFLNREEKNQMIVLLKKLGLAVKHSQNG